jgi:polar amino acid transport system substrate-binding protein
MRIGVLLASLVFLTSASFSGAETLRRLMTEDAVPLVYIKDGQMTGPAYDVVKEIQILVGSDLQVEMLPWKRAFILAETQPGTALFAMVKTEARTPKFKWVGPLAQKTYSLFARKESGLGKSTLSELTDKPVAVQLGGVSEDFVREHGFVRIEPEPHDNQNVRKLLAGRVELWFGAASSLRGILADFEDYSFDDVTEVYQLKTRSLYLAFNKQTPDTVVLKWQAAYEQLLASGKIRAIFESYQLPFMCPCS